MTQCRAKLAKLRRQLEEPDTKTSPSHEGFEVARYGHGMLPVAHSMATWATIRMRSGSVGPWCNAARVAMVGFPSVGKSSLLRQLTGTQTEIAEYAFTTLSCVPGVLRYNGATIQVLDLPGALLHLRCL